MEKLLIMIFRTEKDTMGLVKVPADKYWGAQTQRSLENFIIGNQKMPLQLIKAIAIVKKSAAMANCELGKLPKEKCDLIVKVCNEIINDKLNDHFPLVIWQTGSGTQTNMNVNEVISNRAEELYSGSFGKETAFVAANDDVNKSQSSNDVFPSAMNIAAYIELFNNTIPSLKSLRDVLEQKSEEFSEIVKTGRTHLMDATPVTLGQEFSSYKSQLDHAIKAIEFSLNHLAELPIGGTATGTGLNVPEGFDILSVKYISKYTKCVFKNCENKFEAMAAHDAIVAASGALKQAAVSLMKIANDIRLLASGPRCGIGEILLPENEPGSSIMPGKVNPTQCEALTMVCAQVIGNDTAITIGGMQGHLQLNVFMPLMISNLLQSATLLADACNSINKNCIIGIEPNMQAINENLNNSLMLVTALNPHIGYYNAALIAQKAYKDGLTLKQAAIETGLVTPQQFDEWIDAKKMI